MWMGLGFLEWILSRNRENSLKFIGRNLDLRINNEKLYAKIIIGFFSEKLY